MSSIGVLTGVVTGCFQDTLGGIFAWIIGSPIIGVIAAVLTRLFLESVAVIFRIADDTTELVAGRRVTEYNGRG